MNYEDKDLLSCDKFITLKELAKQVPKGKRKDAFNSLANENFQDKYIEEPTTWEELEQVLGYTVNESSDKPFIRRRKDYASLLKYFLERSQSKSGYSLTMARMFFNKTKQTTRFIDVPLATYKRQLKSKPNNTIGCKIDQLMGSKVNKPFTNLFVVPNKAPVICINENITNYYTSNDLTTPTSTTTTPTVDAKVSRKAEHALGGNSLWLEFDITNEDGTKLSSINDIAIKKAALLDKLNRATGDKDVLQPTLLVSSFHSLHLYFVVDEFIDYEVQRFCLLALQFLFSQVINESTDTACINPERINRFPLGIQVCTDGLQLVRPLKWLNKPYNASRFINYLANQVNSHFDEFIKFANNAATRLNLSLRYKGELLFTHYYNIPIYNEYNGLTKKITTSQNLSSTYANQRTLFSLGKVVIDSIKKHLELHKKYLFYTYHSNNYKHCSNNSANKQSFINDYKNIYDKYPTFSINMIKVLFELVKFEYQYYLLIKQNTDNSINTYRSIFEKYSITTIIEHLKQTINLSSCNSLTKDERLIYTKFIQKATLIKTFIDDNVHFTIADHYGIKVQFKRNVKTLNLIEHVSPTGKIIFGRTATTDIVPYELIIKDNFFTSAVEFITSWQHISSFTNDLINFSIFKDFKNFKNVKNNTIFIFNTPVLFNEEDKLANENTLNKNDDKPINNLSSQVSVSSQTNTTSTFQQVKLSNFTIPKNNITINKINLTDKAINMYQYNLNVLLNHPIDIQCVSNNPLLKAFYEKDVVTLRRLFNVSQNDLTNNGKQVISTNQLASLILKTLGNKLVLLLPYSSTSLSNKLVNENDYVKVSSPFYADKNPSASIYVTKINGTLCQRIKHFSSNSNKSYLDGNIIDVAMFASNIFQQILNKVNSSNNISSSSVSSISSSMSNHINDLLLNRIYKYAFRYTLQFLAVDILNYKLFSHLTDFSLTTCTSNSSLNNTNEKKNDVVVTVDEVFSNKNANEINPFVKLIKKYGDKTLSNILSPKNSNGFVFQESKSFNASTTLENIYNILKKFVTASSVQSAKSFSLNKTYQLLNMTSSLNKTEKHKLIDLCNVYSTILDTFINDLINNKKNIDFRMFTLNYLLKLMNTADFQITKRTLARRLNDLFLIGLLKRQQRNNIIVSPKYNPQRVSNQHNTATHLCFVSPAELTLKHINQSINKLINYVIKENKSFTRFNENDLMCVFGIDALYRFKDAYHVNKLLYSNSSDFSSLVKSSNKTNSSSYINSSNSINKTKNQIGYSTIWNEFIKYDLMQINFHDLLNKIHRTKQTFNQKTLTIKTINDFCINNSKCISRLYITRLKRLILENKFNYKQLNNLLFNFDEKLFCTSNSYRQSFLQQVITLFNPQGLISDPSNSTILSNSTDLTNTVKMNNLSNTSEVINIANDIIHRKNFYDNDKRAIYYYHEFS